MRSMSLGWVVVAMVVGGVGPRGPLEAVAQEPSGSIVDGVAAVLRAENPRLSQIQLRDLAAIPGREAYVVVARGVADSLGTPPDFRNELFVVLVVDGSMRRVKAVLGFIPSERWRDYEVFVDRVSAGSVRLMGRGETYGDAVAEWTFPIPR